MNLSWHKDDDPRWDADRQRLFGPSELASVGLSRPDDGAAVADEWWRVTDDAGELVGYGWLDSEWGDAQISFLVAPAHRGRGVGAFIVARLEDEARRRGLNYIYNVVPDSHPDRRWMTHWLSLHGFRDGGRGELRRAIASTRPGAGAVPS
jgi:GNAT superfamily N-acetyltransferase